MVNLVRVLVIVLMSGSLVSGQNIGSWRTTPLALSGGGVYGQESGGNRNENALMPANSSSSLNIRSMHMTGLAGGWVLIDQRLLNTKNGGEEWIDLTPTSLPPNGRIGGVYFLDGSNGWVLVDEPGVLGDHILTLVSTHDGGNTWWRSVLNVLTKDDVAYFSGSSSIDFVDEQHGWLLLKLASSSNFSVGTLLATSDGGHTWNRLPQPPIGDKVHFTGALSGWLVGGPNDNQLYFTADGGHTWQPATIPLPPDEVSGSAMHLHLAPSFQNDRDGLLTVMFTSGETSRLVQYLSNNGGRTWRSAAVVGPVTGIPSVAVAADSKLVVAYTRTEKLNLIVDQVPESSYTIATSNSKVIGIDFISSHQGWILLSSGMCAQFKQDCHQTTHLFATNDAGSTMRDLTSNLKAALHALAPYHASPQNYEQSDVGQSILSTHSSNSGLANSSAIDSTTRISQKKGFDQCAAGTATQMQDWWTNSPYFDANIYMGGENRTCKLQPNLSSTWVSQIFGQGWGLIPTWVGPQAPCTTCVSCSVIDATTAQSRAVSEADQAASTAAALGLNNSIVYYDMERYNTGNSSCSTTVATFVNAWVVELHSKGFLAGVYGAPANASADWADLANPPDAVWIAEYPLDPNYVPSVFGIPGLSDALWNHDQRIHQYTGGQIETWGSTTFNIDHDIEDGPVAAPSVSQPPTVVTTSASALTSTTATVAGTVNPNGTGTNIWFEWGTSSTLTTSTPTPMQFVGSGTSSVPVSANLAALTPNTTYFFRIDGSNSAGTTRGSILSFTTAPLFSLTVTKFGNGVGTVMSGDGSINCGSNCQANFNSGTVVTLTAMPQTASTFTSWGGACSGAQTTCTVTMNSAQSVSATFTKMSFTLNVAKQGSGSGTVTSGDGQISCGSNCSGTYLQGTLVNLTATAAQGSTFASWNGCDSPSGNTCALTVNSNRTVTATFNTNPVNFTLTVNKAGTGSGTVTSADGQISCGSNCQGNYASGSPVNLTAVAAQGSTFAGWNGCDSPSGNTCSLTVNSNRTVTATFNTAPVNFTLTVNKTGTGSGTVTSGDGQINCGPNCMASYDSGTSVMLTAAAAQGSTFTGWNNCDSPSGNNCTVLMNSNRSLTATFNVLPKLPHGADFDGDGKADLAVWRPDPSSGTWWVVRSSDSSILTRGWGVTNDKPVPGDYDGDGKTDFAVWRPDPNNGTWWVVRSSDGAVVTQTWGITGDIPVPGDYDGDGKTDFAVWRPNANGGTWYVIRSSDGAVMTREWGVTEDIPVPGDYDGDGKTDFAVWRPSTGTWYVIRSSDGAVMTRTWGVTGDIPVPGDYDGDGKTDFAVWRPTTGTWWIIRSSDDGIVTQPWGITGDMPVPGDYDGDGKTDMAIWRPSTGTWYITRSSDGVQFSRIWGVSTDVPLNKPIGQ